MNKHLQDDMIALIGEDAFLELADKSMKSTMLDFVIIARNYFPAWSVTQCRQLQLELIEWLK